MGRSGVERGRGGGTANTFSPYYNYSTETDCGYLRWACYEKDRK